MFITDVQIEGLSDAPILSLSELDREIRITGPDPASTALGDGISLVFAAEATHRSMMTHSAGVR